MRFRIDRVSRRPSVGINRFWFGMPTKHHTIQLVECERKWNRLLTVAVALEVNGRIAACRWRPWYSIIQKKPKFKWISFEWILFFFFNYVDERLEWCAFFVIRSSIRDLHKISSVERVIWELNRNVGKILDSHSKRDYGRPTRCTVHCCLMWIEAAWSMDTRLGTAIQFSFSNAVCCSFAFTVEQSMRGTEIERQRICMQSVSNGRRSRSSIHQAIFSFSYFFFVYIHFFRFSSSNAEAFGVDASLLLFRMRGEKKKYI